MATPSNTEIQATLELIRRLHAAYCEETGGRLVLSVHKEFAWGQWIRFGAQADPPWGVDQLVNTIRFLQTEANAGRRNHASYKFQYLVENPERFETELMYARQDYAAKARLAKKPKFTAGKAEVCRQTGRPDAPADPAPRSVAQVIEDPAQKSRLAQHLEQLRRAAGMAPKPEDPNPPEGSSSDSQISQPAIPPAENNTP